MKKRAWTREELILAFNLYCKIPFGSLHSRNEKIIELANLIDRSPSAVALKLSNFASFDPFHKKRGIKGMRHTSKLDRQVWDEFTNNWGDLIFESETILARKQKTTVERKYKIRIPEEIDQKGKTMIREVKTRVNQNFFRNLILSIYDSRCAVSEINVSELLVAGHILPWSRSEKERLNPENGICLAGLYDLAFDKGFMTINTEYYVVISNSLKRRSEEPFYFQYFGRFEGKRINLPDRFLP